MFSFFIIETSFSVLKSFNFEFKKGDYITLLFFFPFLISRIIKLFLPMVTLTTLDFVIIILFFTITLSIGIYFSKKSGKSSSEFFLSGKTMPWWLLGVSMVATTFSTDTPNLVTDIVRTNGVSGNWVWWAFFNNWTTYCFYLC